MSEHVVRDVPEAGRYELLVDGALAGFADYARRGPVVVLPHTVIDPARRGQGLGAVLVRHVLDDVRRRGERIEPRCWYVAQFVHDHPEYADLVAPDAR